MRCPSPRTSRTSLPSLRCHYERSSAYAPEKGHGAGGDQAHPTDPKNKTWVTRQQHFELVRFWNRIISDLRKQDDQ